MMTNPFSTDALAPNWATASAILKGDVAGHAFHGNQYAAAEAASQADGHREVSAEHERMASAAKQSGDVKGAAAHTAAA